MFYFILITYVLDIVLILYGEISFWSLMRGKGLNRVISKTDQATIQFFSISFKL